MSHLSPSSNALRMSLRAVVVACAMAGLPTHAGDAAQIDALITARDYTAAMREIDAQMRTDYNNPELRLKRGVVLMMQGRDVESVNEFEGLRAAYPNHPAPYTNLAAIHARNGRLEEARAMLSSAVSLDPAQARARVSLANIHLAIAWNELKAASDLQPGQAGVQERLSRVAELFNNDRANNGSALASATGKARGLGSANVAQAAVPPARPEVTTAATARSKYAIARAAEIRAMETRTDDAESFASRSALSSPPPAQTSTTDYVRVTDSELASGQVAVKPANGTLTSRVNARRSGRPADVEGIQSAIESWRSAWSDRSFDGYLSHYSGAFRPGGGMSRTSWATRKKAILDSTKFIKVNVLVNQIKFKSNRAMVQLDQDFESDRFNARAKKALLLKREHGQWKIIGERLLSSKTRGD